MFPLSLYKNQTAKFFLYILRMSSWTPYCPRTGMAHGAALTCGSCLAQRSRTPPSRPRDVEVIDLIESPSSLPPTAITIFASPETSPRTTRFSHYNRTDGAEQLRQVAIARTKPNKPGSAIPVFNLLIHFYLLKQHARTGIRKCDSLFKFEVCDQSLILIRYFNIY
jgi:hypothetical protein